jgi:hypothetical protein
MHSAFIQLFHIFIEIRQLGSRQATAGLTLDMHDSRITTTARPLDQSLRLHE